jgi:beta-1,4-mannosyltransferase
MLAAHPVWTTRPATGLTRTIRVASVPAAHVYVRHLSPVRTDRDQPHVLRPPDPDPDHPGRTTGTKWWPPVMLDPAWIRQHRDEFDVFHLQFGFDACSPELLEEVVDVLGEAGKPFVYTAHDLRNPHHAARAEHDAQLGVIIPGADAVITLTDGAATEIEARWGRRPEVLPHPHVVDLPIMKHRGRIAPGHRPFTVGLHVKSMRACMDPVAILPALVRAVQEIPGAVLQVNGHRDVLEPDGERYDPLLAETLASLPDCATVRVHDFFTDAELYDYLGALDVSVLPYRFGTHSGWLEACRDLGTAVVAPTCGYYRDQGPVFSFQMDEEKLDEDSLVAAVLDAHEQAPCRPVTVEERTEQRQLIAAVHADVYSRLLS